jgi:lipopolysaccharide biosynthesis protein
MAPESACVLAHFDPTGTRSRNLRRLITCLSKSITHTVVVTTGLCESDRAILGSFRRVTLIERHNVGYDFMSYSVGWSYLRANIHFGTTVFCNDSFMIVNSELFSRTIESLVYRSLISDRPQFLCRSNQYRAHGQSFLFCLPAHNSLSADLGHFWDTVKPQISKASVIFNYELGLSDLLYSIGQTPEYVFEPANHDARNPTHYSAPSLARKHGLVKWELVLRNPEKLDFGKYAAAIERVKRRHQYQKLASEKALLSTDAEKPNSNKNEKTVFGIQIANTFNYAARVTACVPLVVHIHCFYTSSIPNLLGASNSFPAGTHVFVTVCSAMTYNHWCRAAKRPDLVWHIFEVENWGRDVRPFHLLINALDSLDPSVPVLKLHGKASLYSSEGARWLADNLEPLAGSSGRVQSALRLFEENPLLGLLGPEPCYVSNEEYWGGNKQNVARLLGAENETALELQFFAGTMFYCRLAAARDFFKEISVTTYDAEAGQRDATLAHAVERAFPMYLAANGFEIRLAESGQPVNPKAISARRLTYY